MSPNDFRFFVAEYFEKIRQDFLYSYSKNHIDSISITASDCGHDNAIKVFMEDGTAFDLLIKKSTS